MQYRDLLAWDVDEAEPDPGQKVALRRYLPVDLLLVRELATTRAAAVDALRTCDRLCTLLDNQPHVVKNDKLLIVALVEHTLTRVVPCPRPRAAARGGGDADGGAAAAAARAHTAGRAARRAAPRRRARGRAAREGRAAGALAARKRRARARGRRQGRDRGRGEEARRGRGDAEAAAAAADAAAPRPRAPAARAAPTTRPIGPSARRPRRAEQRRVHVGRARDVRAPGRAAARAAAARRALAAAACSTQQSLLDAVCVVVPGVACALAGALLRNRDGRPRVARRRAAAPTAAGRQLGVPGYGLSCGTFATQAATIECHYPELAIARTAVLDYFTSPAQRPLAKIMSWEADHVLKPGRPLVALLRSLCREVALAVPHPHALLCDGLPTSSSLMHNSPELRAYRDLSFFWKWFLNPDRSAFPNARAPKKDERPAELKRRPRLAAQLV